MAPGARPPSSSAAPGRRPAAKANRKTKGAAGRNPGAAAQDQLVGGPFWRWRRWLGAVVLLGAAVLAGGLYTLSRVPLPTAKPLQQTTFVYDSSGHVLATFSEQNRVNVSLSQVPPIVVDAVVSTEDRHFLSEGAINPVSIVRAALSDLGGSGSLQGASTITQQYVKQTYLTSQRSITRKLKEAALAIRVSRSESKDQILQGYLNTIYWGRGAYGVGAAAEAYFDKSVSQLGLPEASLLAGLIREPVLADPARDPELARQNQVDTLKALVRDKKITEAQAQAVQAVPFSRYVISPSTSTGAVTSSDGDEYFISAVRQELYAKYGQEVVDGGGLRVTTTLDPNMQSQAYNSIYGQNADALNPAAGEPSGALVSIDDNGEVKALVGGQDYAKSTVDLALGTAGGGSGRQAGSTFKAFMLAYLLKQGYSPLSVFPAPPEVVLPHGNANGSPWAVTNFEHESTAPAMSLVDATADSINTVYAQVVARLGAANLDATAEAMGIRPSELPAAYPSQVLGTADVSPLEMAAAYATFADNGVYHAPLLITRVTTANGTVLPLPVQPQSRVVLTPAQDAQETYVLQQVVLRGTGTAAGNVGSPVAGKTGTTDNSTDAWFIGYTPKLTTAIWMGYASGSKPMLDFRGFSSIQGGTVPAELWHNYMAAVLSAYPAYQGQFPAVYSFNGLTLTPPPASTLEFPEGLGTTTTTTPSTTTTTTTVPRSTTTAPRSTTTTPRTTPTTSPPTTTTPPTTKPPPPTTKVATGT
jgi:membrane peptidoglycan carboxypeptidase